MLRQKNSHIALILAGDKDAILARVILLLVEPVLLLVRVLVVLLVRLIDIFLFVMLREREK